MGERGSFVIYACLLPMEAGVILLFLLVVHHLRTRRNVATHSLQPGLSVVATCLSIPIVGRGN